MKNNKDDKKELINPIRRASDEEVAKIKELMNNNVAFEDAQIIAKKAMEGDKEQTYILLYYSIIDEEDKSFIIKYSRKDMYDTVKNMVEDIDIHKSFILTDLKNGAELKLDEIMENGNVYNFMKVFQEVYKDGFNIEEYNENYI